MPIENEKTVRQILGFLKTNGDVGVEIECEANDGPYFPSHDLPVPWVATHDGSLRGVSVEYVMSKPLSTNKVGPALKELSEEITRTGTNFKYSFRAGVHVHINCQELTPQQVLIFACLYYSLEDVLVEWCGEDRIGNLFCLRLRDAEGLLPYVGDCFKKNKLANLGSNRIRYASLNYCSLVKFGSLEFRAMATTRDFSKIDTWAKILMRLKEESLKFGSIHSILEKFSMSSPEQWCEEILGPHYEEVKEQKDIDFKVWGGIRLAQDLLFYTL